MSVSLLRDFRLYGRRLIPPTNWYHFETIRNRLLNPPMRHYRIAVAHREWVNEGTDATVRLKFEWTSDTNFIVGNYSIKPPQRIIYQHAAHRLTMPIKGCFAHGPLMLMRIW